MSRAKWILAGVTLALVLATIWAVRDTGQRSGYDARSEKLFPDLPAQAAKVRRIEIRSSDDLVTLRGNGNEWTVVEKHDFPADTAKVRALLEGLAGLVLIEPRTSDPARHQALNLTSPDQAGSRAAQVRLLGEADAVLAAVVLGKYRAAAGQGPRQIYLRRPDQDQTWLAEGQADPQRAPALWLHGEAFDLPQAEVSRVTVTHPGSAPVTVQRDKPGEAFTLSGVPAGREPRATGIAAMAYGLQHLTLQNVFKPDEVAADWGQATSSVFDTFDGLSVTARTVRVNQVPHVRLSAAVAASASAEQRAAVAPQAEHLNQRLADWVFVIPPHTAETFTPTLEDVLESNEPPREEPAGPSMPGMPRLPGMPGRS